MVDAEVVLARLAALRTNLTRLQKCIEPGREAFVADEDLYLKAERCLQLALQAMLDIGIPDLELQEFGIRPILPIGPRS